MDVITKMLIGGLCLGFITVIVMFTLLAVDALINQFF